MGLLDSAAGAALNAVGLPNPFAANPETAIRRSDYEGGIIIEEELPDFGIGLSVRLVGNMLPFQPWESGGTQQIIKDYYPGSDEPTVQVLGAREKDIIIRGKLKDKKHNDPQQFFLSEAVKEVLEDIRKRGYQCSLTKGEEKRYGYLSETTFREKSRREFEYELKFETVSFEPPTKCPIIDKRLQIPSDQSAILADLASELAANASDIPSNIPRTIGELLNEAIGAVASVINAVTGFVDDVITTVEDIQKSVNRAVGVCTNAKSEVHRQLIRLGRISYNLDFVGLAVPAKYSAGAFVAQQQTIANDTMKWLEQMRAQFEDLRLTTPRTRYLVKNGDTLAKLGVKFKGSVDFGDRIRIHNKIIDIQQINLVTATADISGSLDGKYFILYDKDGSVAFWFDHGDSGTAEPSHGADRSVEITTVADDDTAPTVASKVSTAINADDQFFTNYTAGSAQIRASDNEVGERTRGSGGTALFDVDIERAGMWNGKLLPGKIIEIPKE